MMKSVDAITTIVPTSPSGYAGQNAPSVMKTLSNRLMSELDLYCPWATERQAANIQAMLDDILTILNSVGVSGQLLPIGSYQLGVYSEEKVAAVCVVPGRIKLQELPAKLHPALEQSLHVRCISTVYPEAHLNAPGLRFLYQDRTVTILFAQHIPDLPMPSSAGVVSDTAGLLAHEISTVLMASVPNV